MMLIKIIHPTSLINTKKRYSLAITIRLSLNIDEQLRYTYKRIYCVAFHGFEPLIIAVIEHLASKGCRLNDFSCLTRFPDDRCLSEQGIVVY